MQRGKRGLALLSHYVYGGSKMGVFNKGSLIHAFEFLEGVKQGCPLAAFFYCLSVQLYAKSVCKIWI